ncbi:alpha/beta hydrolase [Klugiella xanthotipulae]|uniref:Pimeloyl-ACP methyl ester carboxylesterase n=1 Tax=Klugiella xanthotipulae TaxID=244735 RepID=A0A543HY65_9MICO|nr:alpha/beta hydrolase [Klugiella xanthotipulae]TQM63271.1 pimeloyl-ACP methyl ester carboxylesterase [Klugiella xanthotipulae]
MSTTPEPTTEFFFLPGDAERVGAASIPAVRRTSHGPAGATLSALRYGTEPTTVTLLHGAGLNAHTFDPTVLALGEPALSIDLPGHGESAWRVDADYRPQTIAAPVAALITSAVSRPQTLVGQSLGGLTAAVIAAEHPELVNHLVIVDVTPGITPDTGSAAVREFISGQRDFATRDEIVERAVRFGIGEDRAALKRGVFLNTRVRPDGRYEFRHHLAHLTGSEETFSTDYTELWDDLARIRVPLTLVRASNGFVTEAGLAEWRERLPQARVVEVAAGHNVHDYAPVELARIIREARASLG